MYHVTLIFEASYHIMSIITNLLYYMVLYLLVSWQDMSYSVAACSNFWLYRLNGLDSNAVYLLIYHLLCV